MFSIRGLRRTEVHGDAMLHHAILLQNPVENVQRAAAIDHKVFRDDFKPVDDRLAAEDVVVVGNAQPDANAVVLKVVKSVSGHMPLRRSLQISNHVRIVSQRDAAGTGATGDSCRKCAYAEGGLEPSVAQPPLPLQEFCPLQPLSPDLQPPLPLQSFLPLQECLSLSSKLAVLRPALALVTCLLPELPVKVWARSALPLRMPETAAERIIAFTVLFMGIQPPVGAIAWNAWAAPNERPGSSLQTVLWLTRAVEKGKDTAKIVSEEAKLRLLTGKALFPHLMSILAEKSYKKNVKRLAQAGSRFG